MKLIKGLLSAIILAISMPSNADTISKELIMNNNIIPKELILKNRVKILKCVKEKNLKLEKIPVKDINVSGKQTDLIYIGEKNEKMKKNIFKIIKWGVLYLYCG